MSNDLHIALIWICVSANFLLDVYENRRLEKRIRELERRLDLRPPIRPTRKSWLLR